MREMFWYVASDTTMVILFFFDLREPPKFDNLLIWFPVGVVEVVLVEVWVVVLAGSV